MPAERVSMRRVREILRLKHACGASDRAIARSLGIARSTVALTLDRLAAAGLAWPLPETLSERVLEAMLYAGRSSKQGFRRKAEPDWTHVHRELRRPGVTLMLLWEEYRAGEPGGYAYSRWCELYRAWEGRLGGPAVADHAAVAPGRRAAVRRLCRPDGRDRRRADRGGARGAGLRRRHGRLQLHLRRGDLDAVAARLDRVPYAGTRLHGRRAGA